MCRKYPNFSQKIKVVKKILCSNLSRYVETNMGKSAELYTVQLFIYVKFLAKMHTFAAIARRAGKK